MLKSMNIKNEDSAIILLCSPEAIERERRRMRNVFQKKVIYEYQTRLKLKAFNIFRVNTLKNHQKITLIKSAAHHFFTSLKFKYFQKLKRYIFLTIQILRIFILQEYFGKKCIFPTQISKYFSQNKKKKKDFIIKKMLQVILFTIRHQNFNH